MSRRSRRLLAHRFVSPVSLPSSVRRRALWAAGLATTVAVLSLAAPGVSSLIAQDGPRLPGDEVDDDAPVGLSLALPEDAPESIRPRAWDDLPESWADWSEETGDLVADLYSGEIDVERQRAVLRRLRVKLRTLQTAINQPQYGRIRGKLIEFHDQLKLRVELAEAALPAALNPTIGAGDAAVAEQFNELTRRIVTLRNDLQRVNHGAAWVRYFRLDELTAIARNRDDSDDALDQIDAVFAKIDGDDADEEQAEFLERDSIQSLGEHLDELLYFLEEPPSDAEASGERLREVFEAVDEYEQFASRESAMKIKELMRTLPGRFTNGSRLAGILATRYQGENVRGSIDEQLIQRLMEQSNFERGVVNDCVLGARVIGCQFTNSALRVDLLPSPDRARFALNLSGTVQSQTTGYKSPATVYSRGNHQFAANKSVGFDGYRFGATPAAIDVNVNNQVTGVTTSIRFPIIRRIAQKRARQEVAKKQPQAREITRRKITDSVGERFNREVNELLAQAEARLQAKLWTPLSRLGLTPARQQVSSTDRSADLQWLVADADELSASPAPPLPRPVGGVAAQVHESYLNAFADRLDLHGRTFTNEQLRAHINGRLSAAFGRSVSLGSGTARSGGDEAVANARFVFDTVDPARIRLEANRLVLILRTGLEIDDKDDIPTQVVEIPFDITRRGSNVILTQGQVSVSPVEGGGGFRQIARSKVIIQKIEEGGDGQRELNASTTLQAEGKAIPLTLRSLSVAGGWITMTLQ